MSKKSDIFKAITGKNYDDFDNLNTNKQIKKQNTSGLIKDAKGDFFQQILGTTGDILADVGEGLLGFSEGIGDTLTYAGADVVGIFNKDLAKDWKENAKFNSTEAVFGKDKKKNMFGNWRNDLDEYSRSGDFSDMVFKGIGTTAGAVGTAGIGSGAGVWTQTSQAATFIPMFVSSYGNTKSEALNNGADDFNATVSALKSGTIDGFTELMFGALPGLNKGSKLGNTITDAVGKGAEKAFGKTAGKIAVGLTKTMGEGAEEVFGNIFNAQANDILNFITNGKYNYGMENQTGNIFKDTMNVLSDSETWKEFLSASLSAAITQSGTKVFTKTQTNKVIKEYAKDHNIGFNEAKEKLENYSNIFEDITNKKLGYTEALENKEESKAKALNLMKTQYLNNIENQINETTNKAVNSLNERIEQAKAELKQIDEEGVLDANDPEVQKMVLSKYNLNSLDSLSEKEIEQYKNSLREKYVDRLENPDKYTKYQYEETDNERTNKIYKSADKANIDNTKESRDFVDKMVRVANDLKTDVLFTNNEELKTNPNIDLEAIAQDLIQEEQTKKGSELTEKEIEEIKNRVLSEIGGYYNGKTGTIYINADNKTEGAKFIFGHELMHRLEQNKVQEELRKAIFDHAKTKGIYDTERSTLEKLYKGVTKDIDSELVANLLGKLYQDESFVKDLAVKKPNVFTQIFSKLKEMYYKATGQQEKAELEKIVRLYQKVYNEVKEEGFKGKKGTKLSFAGDVGVSNLNQETIDKMNKLKKKAQAKLASGEMDNEGIRRKYKWFQDKNGAWKFEFSNKNTEIKPLEKNKEYKLKNIVKDDILFDLYPQLADVDVAVGNIKTPAGASYENNVIALNNNIVDNEKQVKRSILHEIQHFIQHIEGFEAGKSVARDGIKAYINSLGEIEATEVEERMNKDIDELSFITPENSLENPTHPRKKEIIEKYNQQMYNKNGDFSENYNVLEEQNSLPYTQKENKEDNENGFIHRGVLHKGEVEDTSFSNDIKYSLNKDNQGRELSKQQQEYFKDSKVRDDEGRLLEVYHGTPNGGFTIFDKNKTSRSGRLAQYGHGFYFTNRENAANEYRFSEDGSGNNPTQYKVYLDIKNPFEMSIKSENEHNLDRNKLKQLLVEGTSDYFFDSWIPYSTKTINELNYKLDGLNEEQIKNLSKEEKVDYWLRQEYDPKNFGDKNILQEMYRAYNTNEELIDNFQKIFGYDGIIATNPNGTNQYVAFESNQIKNVDNTNPTTNEDIRYSLSKDNQGRELSEQQQKYFKDSKVRDKNGNLEVVYHGSNKAGFTTFSRNYNFYTNKKDVSQTYTGSSEIVDTKKLESIFDAKSWLKGITDEFYIEDNKVYDYDGEKILEYKNTDELLKNLKRNIQEEIGNTEAGGIYEGYLNITNPLIVNCNGDKWSGIDINGIEDNIDSIFEEFGASTFKENGAIRTSTNDIASAVSEAVDTGALDYDGIIFKNIIDEGMYSSNSKGNNTSDVYVTFNSNQFKALDNTNPTSNEDIRYSLSDTGKTGTLMAIHNLGEDKLKGILELGGFPVPSIAITNPSKVGHNQFGNISVLFDKSTIDPSNEANEVYDRDVWSPTFPQIEYDVNVKALNKVRDIVGGYGNEYLSEANSKLNNIDSLIGNKGYEKLKDELKDNKAFKYVYYKTINPDFKIFTKMDSDDVSTRYSNQFLKEFIDEYGKEIPNWGSIDSETREEIVNKFKKKWIPILEEKRDRIIAEEKAKAEPRKFIIGIAEGTVENNLEWLDSLGGQDKLIENLNEIQRTGGTKEVKDYSKTNEFIDKNVNQKDYEQWLDDNFKNIVGKKGIYNGKEYLTSKGNRRTFNQLHEDYNLSNLVKELTKQSTIAGESGFGAGQNFGTLQAKMSNKFNSIQDIKNAENRIQYDNDTKELLDKYSSDIYEYMNELREYSYNKNHDYYYGDNAGYALNDFADYKVQNVDNLKKALEKNGINSKEVPSKLLNNVVNEINELKNIPTDYFEAKPQRAVGLDEVEVVVIPNTASQELKDALNNAGLDFVEYDPNVEGDRNRVINQYEDLKFNLSNGNNLKDGTITPNDMVVKELYGELPLPTAKQVDLPYADTEKPKEETTEDKRLQNRINKENEKAIKIATKDMELNRQELKQLRQDLEKYKGKTREELTNAETFNDIYDIVSNYANRNYIQTDEELKAVQNEIRKTRIRVPEELKKQITDYNYFRKQNMGRLMLSNSGQSIDSVYEELSNSYPGYFKDATTEADMLYELADFMNKDANTIMEYQLTDTELNNQATKIFNKLVTNTLNENDINEIQEKLSKKKISRKDVRNILLDEMGLTVEDISKGKDINPINYTRTDPIRVNEKVFGNEIGNKINDATINVTKHNEAERTRFLNQERDEIKDLGIKARSKESAAVQKYGEKYYINKQGEKVPYGDIELANEFKDAKTQEKIKKAAEVIRSKYDRYIDSVNKVLDEMGYNIIPKRNDYMHHFQELTDIFSKWGTPFNPQSMSDDLLPTDINGLTEFNKPGKNWFSAAQQRMGEKTTYDAITGIDQYLEGVSNLIYHTGDIQRYRALEELVRNTYGQEHGLENAEGLTEEEFNQRVADIQANKLSGYASWLNEQANTLANKKSTIDRGFEKTFGRKVYSAMNTLKTQVGSNMTGFNVRSALTNFISTTLAASKTNKLAMVKGTVQTINNIFHKDNFIDKSDFLTARFGSDVLSKKGWQKLASAGQIFMSGTDWFTSNVIVRSKYYEGLAKGMTEEQAIKYADDFGFRVMGDRSKGSTANAFNSKTLGLLTQFQLEVNNQWDFMLHDSKRDFNLAEDKSKATAALVFQMGQLAAYSYLANELFEKYTGSRVTFDPIEIFKKLFGLDDDDKDKSVEERMTEASQLLIDSLPFVSTFTGGRIPLSSALPNMEELITGKDKYGNKKSRLDTLKEPLPYLLLPTGYSQLNKTKGALEMYDSSLPVAGSYTDSGNLRFTTKTDAASTARNLLFGKWSSEEAQDYLDSGYKTIPANKVQEMIDLNMDSTEYRAYRKGLSEAGTTNSEKINYINTLPYSDEKKSIMASNVAKKDINMEDYNNYGDYDEFVYATNNPEKYSAITQIADFKTYKQYSDEINNLKQQYDDTNSRKQAIFNYINDLDLNKNQKLMLYRLAGGYSIKNYKTQMFNYIDSLKLSKEEKQTIYNELF